MSRSIPQNLVGVAERVVMSMEDELANLRAERDALAQRLRDQPTVREVAGELRRLHAMLIRNGPKQHAVNAVADLLRRLDESQ